MGDWSSYSLSDFLLFSPRVYERMFVLLNADVWPAQFLAAAFAILLLVCALHPTVARIKAALLILGAAWLVVTTIFFLGRYQSINWLGTYIAPFTALEGFAMLFLGFTKPGNLIAPRETRIAFASALIVLVSGLLIYPFIGSAFGEPLEAAQVFAITADPTAFATLGILALLETRLRLALSLIPLMWCCMTALTLWTLGRPDFFIPPALIVLALIAIAWPRRRNGAAA